VPTLSSMNQLINSSRYITVSEPINFTSYDNSMLGIRMQYPSGWQNAENDLGGIFITKFISPPEDESDVFGDNINIAVENLPSNTTDVFQYTNVSIGLVSRSIPGFNLILSSNSANVSGLPAVEKVFTAKQAALDKNLTAVAVDLKMMQLYTLKNDRGYVITYGAEISNYDKYLPTVQKMISSFQILNLISNISPSSSNTK
jgi:eukaryotic-like serine/threonine-protein kinase